MTASKHPKLSKVIPTHSYIHSRELAYLVRPEEFIFTRSAGLVFGVWGMVWPSQSREAL
jgi:hypothetical protein